MTEPQENDCPVCYNDCGTNPALPCGHKLCSGCETIIKNMDRWTPGARRCPLCRADMPPPAPAQPPPPPVAADDPRLARIRWLARTLQHEGRQHARLTRLLATTQRRLNSLNLSIQAQAQEWNNLVGGETNGTLTIGNATLHAANDALRQRAGLDARRGPIHFAPPVPPAPAPAPQPVAQPPPAPVRLVVAGPAQPEGNKCGHRGCDRRGAAGGVRFLRMSTGQRLFRCPDHVF